MVPIGLIIALLAHRFFLILIFFDSVFFFGTLPRSRTSTGLSVLLVYGGVRDYLARRALPPPPAATTLTTLYVYAAGVAGSATAAVVKYCMA